VPLFVNSSQALSLFNVELGFFPIMVATSADIEFRGTNIHESIIPRIRRKIYM